MIPITLSLILACVATLSLPWFRRFAQQPLQLDSGQTGSPSTVTSRTPTPRSEAGPSNLSHAGLRADNGSHSEPSSGEFAGTVVQYRPQGG